MAYPITDSPSQLSKALNDVVDLLDSTGLAEMVGGRAVLEQGVRDLAAGAMPLAAELLRLQHQKRDLADAVNDPDNAPYATQVHGYLADALALEVPAELVPWCRRIVEMPPPANTDELQRALVHWALRPDNELVRAVARFAVFELLCMIQRLVLLREGVRLESVLGRPDDVAIIAERELQIAEEADAYQASLLETESPLGLLEVLSVAGLAEHVELLREQLKSATRDVHEVLKRHMRIREVAEQLDPVDSVVLLNAVADQLGEQRLTASQLRRKHPAVLEDMTDAAVWKRHERLEESVRRAADEGFTRNRGPKLAELILELGEEWAA